ncbi:MAG: ribosome maturation factor RimP [Elusimicrobiota bacterium]|nr:ribosome maturation factor RimP [Elusimicrobiota bacterium]
MLNKSQEIEILLSPFAQKEGFEIVDIEYIKEDGKRIIRIYIDKDGGVDIADCEKMSAIFGAELDEMDITDESYILEISSPGLYRPLKKEKDFVRFIGSKARIQTLVARNNQRNFLGIILSYNNGILKIDDVTNGAAEIEYSNIRKANLEPEF